MRRIGSELGADPTAVYRHFRGKDELVVELADLAFLTSAMPDPALPWQERLRHVLRAALELYRAQPRLRAPALASSPTTRRACERIAEICSAILAEAGLDPRERGGRLPADHELRRRLRAVHQPAHAGRLGPGHDPGRAPRLRRTAAGRVPALRRVGAPSCSRTMDEVFGLGIDMFIDAIEKRARTTEERA